MRFTRILQTFLVVVTMLLMAMPAFASDGQPPGQIVWGDYTLQSGQTLHGDLIVFGGDVRIEADSRVEGSVVAWGGDVEIAGTVERDVVAFGGDVLLRRTARIEGGLVAMGGRVEREAGAVVRGQQLVNPPQPFWWRWSWGAVPLPLYPAYPSDGLPALMFQVSLRGLEIFLRAVVMAGLAGLVALLWPRAAARVGRSALERPLNAFGMGLLTLIVGILLAIGLIITICLSPAGVAAIIALVVAILFGWLAIGIAIGERLMPTFTARTVAPFWTAALGAGLLTLLSDLLGLIPCVGWIGGFLVTCAGLGAVALTRFGTVE
ncbi:MAG: bactofilin family protein [Anaerolineae bacterium]